MPQEMHISRKLSPLVPPWCDDVSEKHVLCNDVVSRDNVTLTCNSNGMYVIALPTGVSGEQANKICDLITEFIVCCDALLD